MPAGRSSTSGAADGRGLRIYVLFAGGLDVPAYLGSASTFTLGRFGGHGGRALRPGDVLRAGPASTAPGAAVPGRRAPGARAAAWRIAVTEGPHAAPEFFTREDIDAFYAADWEVHFNSARTGVRLIGPRPAGPARRRRGRAAPVEHPRHRLRGGDGRLHRRHADHPRAGRAEPRRLRLPGHGGGGRAVEARPAAPGRHGALRAGRRADGAARAAGVPFRQRAAVRARGGGRRRRRARPARSRRRDPAVMLPARGRRQPARRVRADGPRPRPADARARPGRAGRGPTPARPDRAHARHPVDAGPRRPRRPAGAPAARRSSPRSRTSCRPPRELEVPSRVVHLPLSWDDPATREAIARYMAGVRADAPWCPWNIEFIRRINGLATSDDVQRMVFDAEYLVLGLGDVYLGAPVATPLDPRHRLVTTKYNPARTWTRGELGRHRRRLPVHLRHGGPRRLPVRRAHDADLEPVPAATFAAGIAVAAALLRPDPLAPGRGRGAARAARRPGGRAAGAGDRAGARSAWPPTRRSSRRRPRSIAAFRARQAAAFAAERAAWAAAGEFDPGPRRGGRRPGPAAPTRPARRRGRRRGADVGQRLAGRGRAGDTVAAGERVITLEAMKTEMALDSPFDGRVERVLVGAGDQVDPGAGLMVIVPR